MASLSKSKNGLRTIQVILPDGRRPKIRLGRMSQHEAVETKGHVAKLASSLSTGFPVPDTTLLWVQNLGQDLADRLAELGLIQPRGSATLDAFIGEFIESRSDLKPGTKSGLEQVQTWLVGYFGEHRELRTITAGDADSFWLHMLAGGLGEETAKRHIGRCKQLWRVALRRKVVAENVFIDLRSTGGGNSARFHFVTAADAQKIIDACPDGQWRALFALGRWGGLRVPSEALALRWTDINWEQNRILVHVPKLEHHVGHETRLVPLFPELRKHLDAEFHAAPPGTVHVITQYRESNIRLRRQYLRILAKAGVKPYPKPFQNLRSTRETELAETFPAHVVAAWIGHSEAVAREHYLQVTDAHFDKAAGIVRQAGQNVGQHTPVHRRTGSYWVARIETPTEELAFSGVSEIEANSQDDCSLPAKSL